MIFAIPSCTRNNCALSVVPYSVVVGTANDERNFWLLRLQSMLWHKDVMLQTLYMIVCNISYQCMSVHLYPTHIQYYTYRYKIHQYSHTPPHNHGLRLNTHQYLLVLRYYLTTINHEIFSCTIAGLIVSTKLISHTAFAMVGSR